MPTQRDKPSSPSTVDMATIEEQAEYSGVLRHMLKNKLPLTRAQYASLAFGPGEPDEWTAEHESMLPEVFQQDPIPSSASGEE